MDKINPLNPRDILKNIVEMSYQILIQKLAHGGIKAHNEAAFQHELGYILKNLGGLHEFGLDNKFELEFESYITFNTTSQKSKSNRARVDLVLTYLSATQKVKAAIELKFLKRENGAEPNSRYNVFKDLANIELYRKHNIDLCYFILATDHRHYVDWNLYSRETEDFDFRHNRKYHSGTVLSYNTTKPFGEPISLVNNYHFMWDFINGLYFLKIQI